MHPWRASLSNQEKIKDKLLITKEINGQHSLIKAKSSKFKNRNCKIISNEEFSVIHPVTMTGIRTIVAEVYFVY